MRRSPIILATLLVALTTATSAHAAVTTKKAIAGPVEVDGISQFPTYRDLGAGIYQATLDWDQIALDKPEDATDPLDPSYDWPDEIDEALSEGAKYHIKVALTITGTPKWANGGKAANVAPKDSADFAHFATAAAKRYPGVHIWLVWNEPTQTEGLKPVSAPTYAKLLDGAYGALKAVSTKNVVVGGNSFTIGKITPQKWLQQLKLPNGKRPRMDMYGHDPFSTRKPSLSAVTLGHGYADFSDLDTLEGWVKKYYGKPLKLFLTGWTLPTDKNWKYDFHVTPAQQASWITAALKIVRKEPYIYTLGYDGLYDEDARLDRRQVEGGLISGASEDGGAKRPAFAAFAKG